MAPATGPKMKPTPKETSAEFVAALDKAAAEARAALRRRPTTT